MDGWMSGWMDTRPAYQFSENQGDLNPIGFAAIEPRPAFGTIKFQITLEDSETSMSKSGERCKVISADSGSCQ